MRIWILHRFRSYGQAVLLAAIVAAPVVYSRSTLDTFNLLKLSVIGVLCLTGVWIWGTWSSERGVGLPRFNLLYAAGAFLLAYAVATAFSQSRSVSLIGVYHRYGGLIPVVLYAFVMVLMVGLFWERPDQLEKVPVAVASASVPVAVYTLIQAAGQDWVAWTVGAGSRPEFPVSTLGNSNFVGGYLSIAVPFVVYLIVSAGSRGPRAMAAGVLLLDLPALWFASSRGGYLAAAAGLTLMAIVYRHRLPRWSKALIATLLGGALVLAIVVIWHPGRRQAPEPLTDVSVLRTNTFVVRQYYWSAAWRIFRDQPLVGTGPDTFYANYPKYRLAEDGRQMGLELTDKPHNIYLEYAANAGLLGLGTYLAMAGLALWYATRQTKKRSDPDAGAIADPGQPAPPDKLLLVTFTAAFVAYLVQGVFSIDVPPLALMGWVTFAGIAVLADPGILKARAERNKVLAEKLRSTRGRGRRKGIEDTAVEIVGRATPSAGGFRRALQFAGAAAVLLLAAIGLRPLAADALAASARSSYTGPQAAKKTLATLGKAIDLFALESTYHAMAGDYTLKHPEISRTRAFRMAHDRYRSAQAVEPKSVFLAVTIAELDTRWAEHDAERFKVADRSWRAALRLDPTNWALRFNYAVFLHKWGVVSGDQRTQGRSVALLENVAASRPDRPDVWKALGQAALTLGRNERARSAFHRALSLGPSDPQLLQLLSTASLYEP